MLEKNVSCLLQTDSCVSPEYQAECQCISKSWEDIICVYVLYISIYKLILRYPQDLVFQFWLLL